MVVIDGGRITAVGTHKVLTDLFFSLISYLQQWKCLDNVNCIQEIRLRHAMVEEVDEMKKSVYICSGVFCTAHVLLACYRRKAQSK